MYLCIHTHTHTHTHTYIYIYIYILLCRALLNNVLINMLINILINLLLACYYSLYCLHIFFFSLITFVNIVIYSMNIMYIEYW